MPTGDRQLPDVFLVAIIGISAAGMYEVYARVHLDQTFMMVVLGVVYAA
jgi:hypothetical protein